MSVTNRVMDAIRQTSRQVDGCKYGEIVVKVQDGCVVTVEVLAKIRPKHTIVARWTGHITCACGYEAEAKTNEEAERIYRAHIDGDE